MENHPLFEKGYRRSLKMLAYRVRTVKEIRAALEREKIPEKTADQIIERLRLLEFLNDERYAENYVQSRGERGYGPWRIRRELLQKGIPEKIIAEKLALYFDGEKELRMAGKLLLKKISSDRGKEEGLGRRLAAYLQRRGFSEMTIIRLLDEYSVNNYG